MGHMYMYMYLQVDEQNAYQLRLIGYVGVSISLVCLLLTVFIFCYFKSVGNIYALLLYMHDILCMYTYIYTLPCCGVKRTCFFVCRALWSMRNYIHINLCINLFISQLIFMVGVDKTSNQVLTCMYMYIYVCVFVGGHPTCILADDLEA